MSAGDKWLLPDGSEAIELDGSTREVLRLAPIRRNWPFPTWPVLEYRAACTRAPQRYLHGQTVADEVEEARW